MPEESPSISDISIIGGSRWLGEVSLNSVYRYTSRERAAAHVPVKARLLSEPCPLSALARGSTVLPLCSRARAPLQTHKLHFSADDAARFPSFFSLSFVPLLLLTDRVFIFPRARLFAGSPGDYAGSLVSESGMR